jgi:hypothetical protein
MEPDLRAATLSPRVVPRAGVDNGSTVLPPAVLGCTDVLWRRLLMSSRLLTSLFAATALLSVGCDASTGISDRNAANVRVVHASVSGATTAPPVDVLVDGQTFTGSTNLAYGGTSECRRVNATTPQLTLRQAGTSTAIATPVFGFDAGGRNTVILSGPAANLRITSISDPILPALQPGRARIRVFNGTTRPAALDVTATPFNDPAAARSQANIGQAAATGWLEVPAGGVVQVRLRNFGTTTDVALINVGLTSGEELTLIAVDPVTTGGDLRWVIVSPCPAP